MTEHEQRVTIARWMGDSCQSCQQPLSDEMLPDTCSCKVPSVPDYTRDLNAMHEAEERLPIEQRIVFVDNLRFLLREPSPEHFIVEVARLASAPAAQRAEALLRTLGLWKEPTP